MRQTPSPVSTGDFLANQHETVSSLVNRPVPSTERARARSTRRSDYGPTSAIVRPRDLPRATGLSVVTIWRLRKQGKFPEPIRLTDVAIGWQREVIAEWLASRTRG